MFVPFFKQNIQGLWKDFQGHISHFSRTPFSAKKSLESMFLLVLPQHEQFYPESTSVVAPFPLVWITLAPKFKDFPAKTAIFKDCQEAYKLWTMTMMPTTITITNNDDDYVFKRLFSLIWSWSGYVNFLEPKSICLRRVQSPQDILVQYQHGRCLNVLYTNMATVTWCENDLLSSKDKNSQHHLQITYIKNRWKIRKLQCTFSSSIYNV